MVIAKIVWGKTEYFYSIQQAEVSFSLILINIVPIDTLFNYDRYMTTLLLVVFYIGIVIYLMSALICVYIDQYRLTLIEKGEPK